MKNKMEYDVIIIGGGINGTGIARDCALRGLKTALFEKNDISSGATGACSGMIHGGVRYLMYEVSTTKKSCLDSGYIQKIAPFLIFRIPFILPVTREKGSKIYLELADAYFNAYDWFVPLKRGKPHTFIKGEVLKKIEPLLKGDFEGAVTIDEWGVDPFRLCVLNALSAEENGAEIFTHCEVREIIREMGQVKGVKVFDRLKKEFREVRGKVVVNAGGPWLSRIAKIAQCDVKIRPGKGVHLIFERRLSNYGVIFRAIDGRQVFVMPHDNSYILGTTDDDYYGDLDFLYATHDEVEYLLQAAERIIPDIRKHRILRAMVGIRCTLYKWGINEDLLSRAHKIYDGKEFGADGFFTIAGGKLASYRLMAEEMGDVISEKLGLKTRSSTHKIPLPGAEREVSLTEISKEFNLPMYYLKRAYRKYGCRIEEILKIAQEVETGFNVICKCEPVIDAEIRYAIRKEWAKNLVDVRRRTRLGTGGCQGMRCGFKAALILAEEFGLKPDDAFEIYFEFIKERWKGKSPVLSYGGLPQEEFFRRAIDLQNLKKELKHLPWNQSS
jgi:glycerol-3-phosphate dehydrogenase